MEPRLVLPRLSVCPPSPRRKKLFFANRPNRAPVSTEVTKTRPTPLHERGSYQEEADQLLQMIQALYDIETRAKEMSWQQREELHRHESTIVLAGIKKWLDRPATPKGRFQSKVGVTGFEPATF